MRIISGKLGGRNFDAPPGQRTHPMSDKMRGALFNVLGDIEGMSVLDAFAGSGALGFEALSRGAEQVVMVEMDKTAHQTITTNARSLGLHEGLEVVHAKVASWSDSNRTHLFDIVLCDPPYDDLQLATTQKLINHVKQDGLMVLSWPGQPSPPEMTGLKQVLTRNYGDSQLVFYRKSS